MGSLNEELRTGQSECVHQLFFLRSSSSFITHAVIVSYDCMRQLRCERMIGIETIKLLLWVSCCVGFKFHRACQCACLWHVMSVCFWRVCSTYLSSICLHDCVHGWNFNFNVFWKTDGFLLSLIWNFVESSWKIPSVCSLFLCRLMHKNWCAGFGCVSVLEQASQLTISTPPPIFCPQWKLKNKKGDFTVIVLL